ncbi:MAG: hypothetical protein A2383_02645 [Candidatus Pacebacteria bacterium RIFOXYB1_FULL_39_46]|nr:MAG: hypothetical protein A2383_02645 [Candidatus Pacebacteria bacterium RIFOXYB1_FULL_39_46]OGJ39282.1 MAG: hypothetical protein A2182_02910 [Candidatus Pacebacteria bacterium RIFOXYA1_FULL_38_18]OGJ40962.1 MAG: hypothetical protein A2582_01570 [Candidatus Pacebacteria bacterium RIFOXYD1_FULL_39_27]OGJ41143.1 MAG: hypothetical protein A2411_01490 [Candidatus Pacebacteria bacterium RIFOXYC1_FULL_39_21]
MQFASPSFSQTMTKVSFWLHRIVIWVLTFQALRSTWQTSKLILIEIPASEAKLALGQLTQVDVNFLINDAILMVLSALISFLLASIFTRSKTQATKTLAILISLSVIVINTWLWAYLKNQDSGILVQPLIDLLI